MTMPNLPFSGQLGAFNPDKFANPTSPKYVFLNLAAQHGVNTPEQREALQNALRGHSSGFFTNATLEGDRLKNLTHPDFKGIGQFDVIRDFGGDNGIAWQPEGGGGGAAALATVPITSELHNQQEPGEEELGAAPQLPGAAGRDRVMQQLAVRQSLQPRMY